MLDKRLIESVLADQAEELRAKSRTKFCQRIEENLVDLDSPLAQVVIGVRRSGKSTLCYNVLRKSGKKFAYVNFDDERLAAVTGEDLNNILEVLYKLNGDFDCLFIDEIQNIREWYLFVNRLLRRDMHVLITGSNANLLSGELATHLTGRHHQIILFPFSFGEYCEYTGVDRLSDSTMSMALRRAALDEYIKTGGFPEIQRVKNGDDYIRNLVESILKRDVERRFKISYKTAFEQISQHLLNVAPTIVSTEELGKTFSLKTTHTVNSYIDHLQQAFLILSLHKYSAKSKIRIVNEKIYPVDVALMNRRKNAFSGENLGWRLETIVYIELLRRCQMEGLDVYYFADRSGECDFVICKGNEPVQAVQVSYDIQDTKTRKRELSGLKLVADRTGCHNLLLLTDHVYDDVTINGNSIAIRPAYDYLLGRV